MNNNKSIYELLKLDLICLREQDEHIIEQLEDKAYIVLSAEV